MSLRAQLLAFGLLTLVLPWAGVRFAQEMEAALRGGLESALLASATTVAAAVATESASLSEAAWRGSEDPARTIYAHVLRVPPRVDGFRDDWVLERPDALVLGPGRSVSVGADARFAYVFVAVRDADVVYESLPGEAPYGDRIVLVLGSGPESRTLVLATAAPGQFRARSADRERFVPGAEFEGRVLAAWQETPGGYNVEVRVPIGLTGDSLGIGVVDVDRASGGYAVDVAATWGSGRATASALVYERTRVKALIEQFASVGGRFRVVDRNGWVIATTGSLSAPAEFRGEADATLPERLFRSMLGRDDPPYTALERPVGRLGDETLRAVLDGTPAAAWFARGPSDAAVVAAAAPIRRGPDGAAAGGIVGAVLLEQASDPILTLTNGALTRLVGTTLTVSGAAALALLGYATFLSVRVRRLARAAETALGPRGEINVALPGRRAGDEIGDLARSFADLLGRLREYTDYLRTLTGKLAHELRTPLAIVTTSLDNLEHEVRDASAEAYLGRLREGALRLESILTAMSAATRIEQSVAEAAAEPFDVRAVLVSCAEAYADIHVERRFVCRTPDTAAIVVGSSELCAQLLDKLVENAVSFSPAGSEIVLSLEKLDSGYELGVANEGPLLPESMRHQLFDSLVSVRPERDERPHLGLGLYIVALIAEFHGGRARAENRADGAGVTMRVWFPRGPGRSR